MRLLLLLPLFLPAGVALAQDGLPLPSDVPNYLLSLGPYGALVWGAYLLGRGVSVRVTLAPEERALLERLVRP